MDLPPGMNIGLLVKSGANEKLTIELVSDGENRGGFSFEPEKASMIAAQVLDAARRHHEKCPNSVLSDRTTKDGPRVTIQASEIGLAPCNIPDYELIIVRFGKAELGIALSSKALRSLGEALIALSVSLRNPQ